MYACNLLLLRWGREQDMAVSAVLPYLCVCLIGMTRHVYMSVCLCSMDLCLPAMYLQPYYWSYLGAWSCNSLKLLDPAQYFSCYKSSEIITPISETVILYLQSSHIP